MADPSTPVAADRAAGAAGPAQSETPYLDALRAYAARDPGRFHVPGHKGGPGADPALGIAHCLTPETLDSALASVPGVVGATVVSPTYFGAVADVRGLAEVAHARGLPLVVDEAWGAHLAFHERLPEHALSTGADL